LSYKHELTANFSPFFLTLNASTNCFQLACASAFTLANSGSTVLPLTKPSGAFGMLADGEFEQDDKVIIAASPKVMDMAPRRRADDH